ncbi:unnamed protein product [Hymenolepis diminuta]|uniref:Zer-1-like leucine-rich repeats region domain-containing protein n=1 Tax=Hymenolepis diminuta TaxID=6216 RepID=A0A564Y6T7_HYMDI|nr:unnamed protein product [Hymenolepis diminuta]
MERISDRSKARIASLQSLCVSFIANNFDIFSVTCSDCAQPKLGWRFPYPDYYLPSPVADMILKELTERKILKSEHLTLFSKQNVDLLSVYLRDIDLTSSSLSIFRDFKLCKLVLENVKGISLEVLIENFSEGTFKDLHTLDLRNIAIGENKMLSSILSLGKFQHLQYLRISGTNLNSKSLDILVNNQSGIRFLDISETKVDNISCLRKMKNLTGLVMHQLPLDTISGFETALAALLELNELRILDISHHRLRASSRSSAVDILIESQSLPHLKHFEINGNPYCFTITDVSKFVENHPTLEVLGLLGFNDLLPTVNAATKCRKLEIFGGGGGEERAIKTIRLCKNRPCCLDWAFFEVIDEIEGGIHYTFKIIDAVISALEEQDFPSVAISTGSSIIRSIFVEYGLSNVSAELLNRVYNCVLIGIEKVDDADDIPNIICDILLQGKTEIDYRRCFNIGLRCLEIYRVSETLADALYLSRCCIGFLSEAEIGEAAFNSSYIKSLLKCAAELYLEKEDAKKLIEEYGEEKLFYLKDFEEIITEDDTWGNLFPSNGDVIAMLKRLMENRPYACSSFITLGGIEILTKILEVVDFDADSENLLNILIAVLRMAKFPYK